MITLEEREEFKKVDLRCKTCRTCPIVQFNVEKDLVQLDDDHGNTNKWTMENFREFARQVKGGAFDEFLDNENTIK